MEIVNRKKLLAEISELICNDTGKAQPSMVDCTGMQCVDCPMGSKADMQDLIDFLREE